MSLLEIKNLQVSIAVPAGLVHAVRGIDLEVRRGEIFGLVGESGCGKTLTSLSIIGLTPAQATVTAETMRLGQIDLQRCDWRQVRGRRVAMIFQDPAAALNPVFTIGSQIRQVLRSHASLGRVEERGRAFALLDDVGLPEPARILGMYPHELSGGMQQRAMIALALASGAELLLADEPTTALDVTIQAQILRLLRDLRERRGLTIVLITHDLGVVAQICDRVAVLYAGQVVETAPTSELFRHPRHPYTQALLDALPRQGTRGRRLEAIEGSVPPGLGDLVGCPFAPRCRRAFARCRHEPPLLQERDPRQWVACHWYEDDEQNTA